MHKEKLISIQQFYDEIITWVEFYYKAGRQKSVNKQLKTWLILEKYRENDSKLREWKVKLIKYNWSRTINSIKY